MNKVYNVFCLVSVIGSMILGYTCMSDLQAIGHNSSVSQLVYIAKK